MLRLMVVIIIIAGKAIAEAFVTVSTVTRVWSLWRMCVCVCVHLIKSARIRLLSRLSKSLIRENNEQQQRDMQIILAPRIGTQKKDNSKQFARQLFSHRFNVLMEEKKMQPILFRKLTAGFYPLVSI